MAIVVIRETTIDTCQCCRHTLANVGPWNNSHKGDLGEGWGLVVGKVALTTIAARNRKRSKFIFIFDYVENEAGAWRMRQVLGE